PLRTLAFLTAWSVPVSAQQSTAPAWTAAVQYSHLRMRKDNGTVQGASGSGLSLRVGMRPLSSAPRLLAEGVATYIPNNNDTFDGHPPVWSANLGALYSLSPMGARDTPVNPFAALAIGFIAYDKPSTPPLPCLPEEGCLDESPDLEGTKPSMAVGGGSWFSLGAAMALRVDLRLHHRFDSNDSEDAWSPEISAGAGVHF
ncbi:MAG TPA: outer membrane beta-barrel protein, partial [Gemmatimonadales bacterium]|nr:outer membrane beta-barrel protein [Gemmatimonadales bacterium]